MGKTVRISIALEEELLQRFDEQRQQHAYGNRSEAIRDLIRQSFVDEEWKANQVVVGTITLLYDHHVRELSQHLTRKQHDCQAEVLSTLHVHLDHDNCLEAIVVKGEAHEVRALADSLIGTRGVRHGKLTATSLGKSIA